jgi:hypothetical protein
MRIANSLGKLAKEDHVTLNTCAAQATREGRAVAAVIALATQNERSFAG